MPNQYPISKWLHDLETRNVEEIQLGLDRVLSVAEHQQLQHLSCPVITVAGTNGKGSTVAALETIYDAAGFKVGAYTSPHLLQFNERIRVNAKPISDHELSQAFSVIEHIRGETLLTYFEMVTLAALWHFKRMELDIVILEVGLGGRLDATNIVDADLSIITTVDLDHQDYLGNTVEAIGQEKAGILRTGKPFIYADFNPPESVICAAEQQSAPAYYLGREFSINEEGSRWSISYKAKHNALLPEAVNDLPKPAIQLKSAAAAITASLVLTPVLPVNPLHVQMAMETVFIPGRLQLQRGIVDVMYDVSHNPQSVKLLADTLKRIPKTRVHAVFSALKDKDIFGLIFPLKDCVDFWYPAQLDNKRAASADLLLTCFGQADVAVEICYDNPLVAFETALKQAEPGDLVVVYGSFFTVSQILGKKNLNG